MDNDTELYRLLVAERKRLRERLESCEHRLKELASQGLSSMATPQFHDEAVTYESIKERLGHVEWLLDNENL